MQEKYTTADMAGQQDTPSFNGATATLTDCQVTTDGQMRLARQTNGVFVFRKLESIEQVLDAKRLPTEGGTYMGNPKWAGPGGKPM